jgi:hypothetical protein
VIVWTLTNGQNGVGDVQVATILPDGVEWEDDASSGMAFDEATRQVTYTRDTLNPGTELQLQFAVSVTPTTADVNKLLVLTEETLLRAQNTFTEKQMTAEQPRITSDLPNDEGASGKGVVER